MKSEIISIPEGQTKESFLLVKKNQLERIKDLYDDFMIDQDCFNTEMKMKMGTVLMQLVFLKQELESMK